MSPNINLKNLSDQILLEKTKSLVESEREILTEVLRHLREIQRRRLYSDLRLPSLFSYCTLVLKYSESQAQRRIAAMRLIAEIPEIEERVSSGELSLSNVSMAKTFFNQEEKCAPMSSNEKLKVLEELRNKSSREGEKILLSKSSIPAKSVVEKIRQVTAEIAEVKFAADEKLLAKINRLKGLMAHRKPGISISELIDELCEIALSKLDPLRYESKKSVREKAGLPKNIPPAPKVENSTTKSTRAYISVNTKREIWKKAEGQCENCKNEYSLETDHIKPHSLGGSSEVKNLRLLCRQCNQRAAIKKIGQYHMQRFLEKELN